MPRRVAIMILITLVVAMGALWLFLRDRSVDPSTVGLPPLSASPGAVKEYLAGPGHALVLFTQKTSRLTPESSDQVCQAIAAELDALGRPELLLQLARDVPDAGIRDATINHLDTVSRYLGSCGAAQDLNAASESTQFTATVLNRLFEREGVA